MMRTSLLAAAGIATACALVGASATGCSGNSKSPTATSGSAASTTAGQSSASTPAPAPAQPTDYASLLIRAEDINAPEAFTASAPVQNPDGKQGVAATFSVADGSHVIHDTILIMPDPAAAASALSAATTTPPVPTIGAPSPVNVGTGGTSVWGNTADKSKGVTVLWFTEGKAFVTLEFDGPGGLPAPSDFVSDVGSKQDTAIKNGLPG
jgi:hypothetical protein